MTQTEIIRTKTLSPDEAGQIDRLWNEAYPKSLADRFGLLLDGASEYHHYLIKGEHDKVVGWAAEFLKDGETRFCIIVHPEHRGRGHGRLLLNNIKAHLREFYGWVIDHENDVRANGEIYRTPMPFYLENGFEILAGQRLETRTISAAKIKWCADVDERTGII